MKRTGLQKSLPIVLSSASLLSWALLIAGLIMYNSPLAEGGFIGAISFLALSLPAMLVFLFKTPSVFQDLDLKVFKWLFVVRHLVGLVPISLFVYYFYYLGWNETQHGPFAFPPPDFFDIWYSILALACCLFVFLPLITAYVTLLKWLDNQEPAYAVIGGWLALYQLTWILLDMIPILFLMD